MCLHQANDYYFADLRELYFFCVYHLYPEPEITVLGYDYRIIPRVFCEQFHYFFNHRRSFFLLELLPCPGASSDSTTSQMGDTGDCATVAMAGLERQPRRMPVSITSFGTCQLRRTLIHLSNGSWIPRTTISSSLTPPLHRSHPQGGSVRSRVSFLKLPYSFRLNLALGVLSSPCAS
jgi:hypothetical protein